MYINDALEKIEKALKHYDVVLSQIRTGRANVNLLDNIMVHCHDNILALPKIANIKILDNNTLSIQAWDTSINKNIEKAIRESDLGLNPNVGSTSILVPIPPLTEERRLALVKVIKYEAEEAKITLRNIRRDVNNTIDNDHKNKVISKDDRSRLQQQLQKLIDEFTDKINKRTADKEKLLMAM